MSSKNVSLTVFAATLLVVTLVPLCAHAQTTITSPSGDFEVGIAPNGELYDDTSGVGFLRVSDNYDPIAPGTPRDSWGISAGSTDGYANHERYGVYNVTPTASSFGPNSGVITDVMGGGLLQINQSYSFAADNVLRINTTITNTSGTPQAVRFSRNVDFDITPTEFDEITRVDPYSSPISAASYYGFENPNPLVAFIYPVPVGGGVDGPDDLGAAYQLDLGTLAAGASSSFDVYYADSEIGQSEEGLRTQLYGLGANFVSTTVNSGTYENTAALAYGPVTTPEPSTLVLLGIGAISMLAYGWRRQKQTVHTCTRVAFFLLAQCVLLSVAQADGFHSPDGKTGQQSVAARDAANAAATAAISDGAVGSAGYACAADEDGNTVDHVASVSEFGNLGVVLAGIIACLLSCGLWFPAVFDALFAGEMRGALTFT